MIKWQVKDEKEDMVNVKNVGKSTRIEKKPDTVGSFVGNLPQPKCPASVEI